MDFLQQTFVQYDLQEINIFLIKNLIFWQVYPLQKIFFVFFCEFYTKILHLGQKLAWVLTMPF